MVRVGWSIPKWLAATAIVGCGPQVGPGDDTVADTFETSTGDAPETSSSATLDDTTTIDPSTSESTTDESTTGPIELPDCGMHSYVAECNDEDFCTWQMGVGCVVECPLITDQAQCLSFDHCEWFGTCEFEGAI